MWHDHELGPIKLVVLSAKLTNKSEVTMFLDQGSCGDLTLRFVPSDEGVVTKEYVNWLPCAESMSFQRNFPVFNQVFNENAI